MIRRYFDHFGKSTPERTGHLPRHPRGGRTLTGRRRRVEPLEEVWRIRTNRTVPPVCLSTWPGVRVSTIVPRDSSGVKVVKEEGVGLRKNLVESV